MRLGWFVIGGRIGRAKYFETEDLRFDKRERFAVDFYEAFACLEI